MRNNKIIILIVFLIIGSFFISGCSIYETSELNLQVECSSDTDCGSNESCFSNKCEYIECRIDSDCEVNQFCFGKEGNCIQGKFEYRCYERGDNKCKTICKSDKDCEIGVCLPISRCKGDNCEVIFVC